MKWTREKPTRSGYYWYYDVEFLEMALVSVTDAKRQDQSVLFHGSEVPYRLHNNSEWGYWSAEPIPVPDIPKEEE